MMNRNLHLPKYLIKRKADLLRRKVCLRKFAYLWYRLSTSIILPSVAYKHYEQRLKWNAFRKLRNCWFESNVVWKLEVRADIHHNITLKQKCMKQWLCFHISRKQLELKQQIADAYFKRTLKIRYYTKLKYARDAININEMYGSTMQLHITYVYLNFNLLQYMRNYYEICENYTLQILLHNNYQPRIMRKCLRKLQQYANYSIQRRELNYKAKCFFRYKYGQKIKQKYFYMWKQYVASHQSKQNNKGRAIKHFNFRLLQRCFLKMRNYSTYRILKNKIKEAAVTYHQEKLMRKICIHWKMFVNIKQNMRFKKAIALSHYEVLLKRLCFANLKKYRIQQLETRSKLKVFRASKERNLLHFCFQKLKTYVNHSILKKKKCLTAQLHYKCELQKKCFKLLQKFQAHRKAKQLRLRELVHKKEKTTLGYCFKKWRKYVENIRAKKVRFASVDEYLKMLLFKRYFGYLRKFKNHRQFKKAQQIVSHRHYLHKLTSNTFGEWKRFFAEQQKIKKKLLQAEQFYKCSLQKLTLRVILEEGIHKQQEKEKIVFEQILRRYKIAYKYYNVWKNKTVAIDKFKHKCDYSHHTFEVFQWNPLCFAKPRIPEFLKHMS